MTFYSAQDEIAAYAALRQALGLPADADAAAIRAALLRAGAVRDDVAGLLRLVGLDGVRAAREVLK
jgi:hypothetical protein